MADVRHYFSICNKTCAFLQALIGDKYGYRPIPSSIRKDLFETLKLHGDCKESCDWSMVDEWYLCDENSVPPVYILQPISAKIDNYNDMVIIVIISEGVKLT